MTFLFTDLEGSTRLWQEHPDEMQHALAHHDELIRNAVEKHRGHVVKTTGDGFHAVFAEPVDALQAAVEGQRALSAVAWETTGPLRVRMGLHTGAAQLRAGDYYGSVLNRAARLMSIAHGGQIVCSQATTSLVRDVAPPELTFEDLGDHRLRDLTEPERVFQLVAPGLALEFPPLTSLDARATNLPAQVTSFLGRDADLEDVDSLLRDHALVTITGVGGVGKTRLALQVAADAMPRFRDGVWVFELASALDPDSVVEIVAEVLDARPRPGLSSSEAIVEVLRSRRTLLVLDNCEHVLDVVAELAGMILGRCPDVRILATSREALAIDGERVRPLSSFAMPSAEGDASESIAVALFVDRARALRPDFGLDGSTRASVVEICRRLDGIPLAIELAAARVVAMHPDEIAALLDERFRLLTGTRRGVVERHQTLRATVAWSYSLLTPAEQCVFDRLSVFAGSFDADAASDVTRDDLLGPWEIREAIEGLVAKSMLNLDARASTTRYSMLETLRSYAREQLEAQTDSTSDVWRRRHADYYARVAGGYGATIHGPEEIDILARIRADLDNLRAATFWSLGTDDGHRYALDIVASLASLASLDRSTGVPSWAEQALPFLPETTPGRASAVLGAAAWRAFDQGQWDLAIERATAALLHIHEPECSEPAQILVLLGVHGMFTSSAEPIARLRDEIEVFAATPGRQYEETVLCASYSTLAAFFPEHAPHALAYAERALARSERQSATARGNAFFAMGMALDDPSRAAEYFEASIALTDAGASDTVYGHAQRSAARLALRAGDIQKASEHLRRAIQHSDHVGDHPTLGIAFDEGALFMFEAGHTEMGVTLLGRAGASPIAAYLHPDDAALAHDYERRSRDELGDTTFDQAYRRGAELDTHDLVAATLEELATISERTSSSRHDATLSRAHRPERNRS